MRIEFGFQANCSELVTHLGIGGTKPIIQALAHIANITGWTWWTDIKMKYIPIKTGELEALVGFGNHKMGVDLYKLFELHPEAFDKGSRNRPAKNEWLSICLSPEKTVDECPGGRPSASLSAGVSNNRLTIDIPHVAVHAMPAFHAIRMEYKSDMVANDGGSPHYYYEWLAHHFIEGEKQGGAREKATDGKWTYEKEDEYKERYERNPPIDRSKGMFEEDKKKAIEYLDL